MDKGNAAVLCAAGLEEFSLLYADMQRQFPAEELYPENQFRSHIERGRYQIFLYKRAADNKLVGYALMFYPAGGAVVWLDYIAVLDEFKGMGYGGGLFRALCRRFGDSSIGMLFSVEHVQEDGTQAEKQRGRLSFYAKMGAIPLQADFQLPTDDGALPMYLYYKPFQAYPLKRELQLRAVTDMYDYCFGYLPHRWQLLESSKDSYIDEEVTVSR